MVKNNRKSFKLFSSSMLTICVVAFGLPSESKASWILEEGSKFIERKIIRPAKNATEDIITAFERSILRTKSNNLEEIIIQSWMDCIEDTGTIIKRRVIEPGKDFLKDL